jgi:hypothetical protein
MPVEPGSFLSDPRWTRDFERAQALYWGQRRITEDDQDMTDDRSTPRGERPRSEPEIFPPGAPVRPSQTDPFGQSEFVQRIHITRLGPFGFFVLALMIGLVAAVLLILLVGAVLFWIPIVGLIVAAAILLGTLRSRFRRR